MNFDVETLKKTALPIVMMLKEKYMALSPRNKNIVIAVAALLFFMIFSCDSPEAKINRIVEKELMPLVCNQMKIAEEYKEMALSNPMMEMQKDLAYEGMAGKLQHLDVGQEKVKELMERKADVENKIADLKKSIGDELAQLSAKDKSKLESSMAKKLTSPSCE